jgi:hypothetical protein
MQTPLQYVVDYWLMVGEPPVLRRHIGELSQTLFEKFDQAWSLLGGFFTLHVMNKLNLGAPVAVTAAFSVFLILLAGGMRRLDNLSTDLSAADMSLPKLRFVWRGLASVCAIGALLALLSCLTLLVRPQSG